MPTAACLFAFADLLLCQLLLEDLALRLQGLGAELSAPKAAVGSGKCDSCHRCSEHTAHSSSSSNQYGSINKARHSTSVIA